MKACKKVNANNHEGYSSDMTTPGLNDGEKIPTRTETPKNVEGQIRSTFRLSTGKTKYALRVHISS